MKIRTEPAGGPVSDLLAAPMNILLVDDSEDSRFLLLSYLKRTGSSVDVAENGAAAVQLFGEKLRSGDTYHVILMDVEMPVMDGYAATQAVRKLEQASGTASIPVLALTAHSSELIRVRSLEAGYTDLLTKPIRPVTLLEALARYAPSSMPTVKIIVEASMADIVPAYLEKRRAEVATYRDALAKGDMDAIRMKAHRMKGTGSGYGLPVLTEIGGTLETAALTADSAVIQMAIDELARYLDRVGLEYKLN